MERVHAQAGACVVVGTLMGTSATSHLAPMASGLGDRLRHAALRSGSKPDRLIDLTAGVPGDDGADSLARGAGRGDGRGHAGRRGQVGRLLRQRETHGGSPRLA